MAVLVGTINDENQPEVVEFADGLVPVVADGCLVLFDGDHPVAGFAPDLWSTFRVV